MGMLELLIAALAGGLLGLERESSNRLTGARTFMLISTAGALSSEAASHAGYVLMLPATLLGSFMLAAFIGIMRCLIEDDTGMTTTVSFAIAFLIGVLVGFGYLLEGAIMAILATLILSLKEYTLALTRAMSHREIANAMEFGMVAFVLYPILPEQPLDPWGLVSPKKLVFVVIVVTSIGFAGFLALRWFGADIGMPVAGALGGLVNSQAAVGALSARAKQSSELEEPVLHAVLLAGSVALLRSLAIATALSTQVASFMLAPSLVMALMLGMPASFRLGREKGRRLELEMPFAVLPAVKFALIFTGITALVKVAQSISEQGMYLAAFIAGMASSGAVVASFSMLAARGELAPEVAGACAVLSGIASILSKLVLVRASGTPRLCRRAAGYYSAAAIAGALVLLLELYTPFS
ncbi:MAG: MgtC/SapB family protein [Euryarchaeota archaeon]|nr:MgtC/SapB family protein [Euryarchaeota archaeon]